jgi:chromosome segregation ATPase
MFVLLVVVVVLVLLGLSFMAGRRLSAEETEKEKKASRRSIPEVVRNDSPDMERLNRKVLAMQGKLDSLQGVLAQKEKAIAEAVLMNDDLRRQLEQEKNWQRREEDAFIKSREREKSFKEELRLCQAQLAEESSRRIVLEGEKKDLSSQNSGLSQELYQLNSLKLVMERQVQMLTDDGRGLRTQNAELRRKKEAEQWVAKSDYVHLQNEFRRLKARLENMKLPAANSSVPVRDQEQAKFGL